MSTPATRILVVEDQRLIAADIEGTLTKLGYAVVANVASGEEAVSKALDVRPDIVLMDVRLGGRMDGIEAARLIHEQMDVPVVYLTAYADEETIARAKATEPFGYVVKPFNERELRAALEIALYRYETDRLLAAERAKRQAAEEFKLLVQGVTDYAIFILHPSGHVATWNEGAARIYGADEAWVLGKPLSVLHLPGEGDAAQTLFRVALRDGRAEDEGWRARADGSRFWANVVLTAIRENGTLRGVGAITRDLTERKSMELQLRDAIRARDEFLQMASHELKTPLTPLQLQLEALTQALEEAGVESQRIARKLEVAMRQTRRLARLVENLVDVSLIAAGHLSVAHEPVELAAVSRHVADRFRTEAHRAGSEITVHAGAAPAASGDRRRVEQILANLVSNAIQYGAGRPIEIEVGATDGAPCVSVTDHGIGIEPEALERIFGRFERAVSVHHFGGLGLGLFIARQLADAQGGTLRAASRPGAGSVFTLELPSAA